MPYLMHIPNPVRVALVAGCFAAMAAACGGAENNAATGTATTAATASPAAEVAYAPAITPANFSTTVDNPYLPYPVGTSWIYDGESDEGAEHRIVEVLAQTRTVMGVECIVVRDIVMLEGEVIEDTLDWYAQDTEGNVWYFGEESKDYEDGKLVSTHGSWEAGVDGALPGIVMPARPASGQPYRQEYYPGEAEDMAEVLSLSESVDIPAGAFSGLLMTRDYTPLEPDVVEHKYYARGVGLVVEQAVSGGSDRLELVEVIHP